MKPIQCGLALAALLTTSAHAGAPEPTKPIDLGRFMGRWYEILRTPNRNERNCFAPYEDWSNNGGADIQVTIVCHRGAAAGPLQVIRTTTRVLNPPQNTKYESKIFGFLVVGRYWVVDHAPDYSWMIATTQDGRFPALLSRGSGITASQRQALESRMAQLGFDVFKLEASNSRSPTLRVDGR